MDYSYSKKKLWKWIILYLVIGIVVYGLIYYFFFYNKDGYKYGLQQNQNSEMAGWKTYQNNEYGFEFQYPKDVVVINRSQNIVDIADAANGYTVNWSLKLYKNNSSQSLVNWVKSEFSEFKDLKNKDCKVLKADAYGPKVEIKNVLSVLIAQTSDFDESCADQGYYVISSSNLTIVKFEDVTQASPGHLQDIVSTFTFTK